MKYKKGTFVVVPNIEFLSGKPVGYQALFLWLCKYSDEDGICFPSRRKLAEHIGSAMRTVDKYIEMMETDGILCKTKRRKLGDITNKSNLYQILITDEQGANFVEQGAKNDTDQGANNVPVTIPSINSIQVTELQTAKIEEKVEETVIVTPGQLPVNRGTTRIQRVSSVYKDLFRDKYGIYPNLDMMKTGGAIDSLSKRYTELQISAMLISFFNWAGMAGSDDFARQKLLDATHPFAWFYTTVNQYEVYLRNVFGLDFDNEDKVREFVAKNLLAIKK